MPLYTARVSGQALVAATPQTLIQVHAATTRVVKVVEFGVSFDGTTASAVPVLIDLMRQGSVGTSSAFTPLKLDESGVAAVSDVRTAFTAEPTSGSVLQSWYLTPNGGLLVMQYPFGREVVVGTDGRVGIRANAPANVNASAYLVYEE